MQETDALENVKVGDVFYVKSYDWNPPISGYKKITCVKITPKSVFFDNGEKTLKEKIISKCGFLLLTKEIELEMRINIARYKLRNMFDGDKKPCDDKILRMYEIYIEGK